MLFFGFRSKRLIPCGVFEIGTGVGSGGGGGGKGDMCPPPLFRVGGQRYVCAPPPHFQIQNLGLGIEPTDICDVTLAWLASRCWARQMCPPTHTHILSRSYAVELVQNQRRIWRGGAHAAPSYLCRLRYFSLNKIVRCKYKNLLIFPCAFGVHVGWGYPLPK